MFNIRPEIADFFKSYFQSGTDGRNLFNYGHTAFETWTTGLHRIPTTQEIWLAGAAAPDIITDLYISYSAADLICFTSQRPHYLLRCPEQQAFAALGLLPTSKQVQFLKSIFPYARWHLLFHHDLLGDIADASIAAWFNNRQVSFRYKATQIIGIYRNKAYYFDISTFSLHRFELATGLRAGMRTHKPPSGFNSFLAYQNLNEHDT